MRLSMTYDVGPTRGCRDRVAEVPQRIMGTRPPREWTSPGILRCRMSGVLPILNLRRRFGRGIGDVRCGVSPGGHGLALLARALARDHASPRGGGPARRP